MGDLAAVSENAQVRSGSNPSSAWRRVLSSLVDRARPRTPIHAALLVVGVVAWLVAGTCAVYQYAWLGPPTDRHREALVAEIAAMPAPPGVPHPTITSDSKPGQALVTATYRSDPNWAALRQFYDPMLAGSGWAFSREKALAPFLVACYVRSGERASLTYRPGEQTYSLAFDFGFGGCD